MGQWHICDHPHCLSGLGCFVGDKALFVILQALFSATGWKDSGSPSDFMEQRWTAWTGRLVPTQSLHHVDLVSKETSEDQGSV